MNMINFTVRFKMTLTGLRTAIVSGAAIVCAASCVYVDDNLGQNFIPANQIYEVKLATMPLDDVKMGYSDSLSAYSSSRITVGALRDATFGLTTRSSAFTVVPVMDTIDVGDNPKVIQFHFTAAKDTTSYADESQRNIIQNINVFKLKSKLDSTFMYSIDSPVYDGAERITKGVPTYSGGDSLSFDFSDDFADEIIGIFKKDEDIQLDLNAYLKEMPGIYISTDDPVGEGGRINMFDCPISISNSYYVTGNYAELKIRTDYGARKDVDTSFLFYFGPAERTTETSQYAFNICRTSSESNNIVQKAAQYPYNAKILRYVSNDNEASIYAEGGSGLKPVISAMGIREQLDEMLAAEGLSPDDVIINKASLNFNINRDKDYGRNYLLADILSPTCKFSYRTDMNHSESEGNNPLPESGGDDMIRYVSYAGLTDASVESENQGDVNFSLSTYNPDISHHAQEILKAPMDSLKTGRYDIWLLIMETVVVTTTDENQQELSEYYQNLAYASYYNNLYGGYGYGYGYGYGGYGYGSYYNNYYNYMLAAQYASASATQQESQTQLDKDKYYHTVLYGPGAADESLRPALSLVYSYIPRDSDASGSGE